MPNRDIKKAPGLAGLGAGTETSREAVSYKYYSKPKRRLSITKYPYLLTPLHQWAAELEAELYRELARINRGLDLLDRGILKVTT